MRWTPVLLMLVACGDPQAQPDAAVGSDALIDAPRDVDPKNPPTLMDTGLCVDNACTQIAAGIKPYTPQFQLWSDTATKKRWIYLPPGTQIDTTDMDFWQFPVGTKLWKEFTRDSMRVETRLVMRIGSEDTTNDWFYVAYVWNATQDATTAEPFGVPDANGTQHDVPGRVQCKACHDNTSPSRVLGFSAIQLDWDNPNPDEYDLKSLVSANLLTSSPPQNAGPSYPLPGNSTEKLALGYLHANCGHCHNPHSKVYTDDMTILMELRLTVGTLGSVGATPVYTTAVNQNTELVAGGGGFTKIVAPQNPDQSALIYRFESTNAAEHMPKEGSEVMDPTGRTKLRDWITNIP